LIERENAMKKHIVITGMILAVLVSQTFAGGQGSAKIPFDPDVGWVVLNTTGDGRLLATVHLEDARPDAEFGITVRVRYEDQSTEVFEEVAFLTTNGQGKGNAQVEVAVNPSDGSTTLRRVAIRVRRAPNPVYVAVGWDLPLK
jgi:hypothetical protein